MDKDKEVLEELRNIYEIVRNQLVFAESKNTTVIVFNAASLAYFLNQDNINSFIGVVAMALASAACILGILSFSPLKYNVHHFKKIDKDNNSLIYFRNIAAYKREDYLEAIYSKFGLKYKKDSNIMTQDYAEEIIVIANITVVKNDIFMVAMVLTAIAIFLMALVIIM